MDISERFNLEEALARIEQLRAQSERLHQEVTWEPTKVLVAGLTAGASVLAAGAAIGGAIAAWLLQR